MSYRRQLGHVPNWRLEQIMKRHRSAKSGEFVTEKEADESPDTTIAETGKPIPEGKTRGNTNPAPTRPRPSAPSSQTQPPNIKVVPDIWLVDLEGMVKILSAEGVILSVCCQPDSRYTIIVEKA